MSRQGPLRQRLLSRLIVSETGCLLWAGTLNRGGYGEIKANGRTSKVHRVMWEMFEEPIPEGMDLDHLCRVRHCANLAHLEVVTRRVNTMRGEAPSAANATKATCPAGHEYDYMHPSGGRRCRRCTNAACRRYRARKEGQATSGSGANWRATADRQDIAPRDYLVGVMAAGTEAGHE